MFHTPIQQPTTVTSLPLEVRMQPVKMRMYYKAHADIYDATRWTFLFGRKELLKLLSVKNTHSLTIMEIGCGTGYNLFRLADMYPDAQLIGWDVSEDMIREAENKLRDVNNEVKLINEPYGLASFPSPQADIILFSYCLTMVNPHWQDLILQAAKDLKPNGMIAVVDFHQTPLGLYRRFMRNNHVEIQGQILPFLHQHFQVSQSKIQKAYGGLWSYFNFIGRVNSTLVL